MLTIFSHYFSYLFNDKYSQGKEIFINIPGCDPEIFRIVLAYMHTNTLVVPSQCDYSLFKAIAWLG
ncbi:MAG: BTB/POZ domain-containing protein [Bdellovibrionales bacterium]|nr:BTB/POZ domain-containing protein [Bdellovibrionales bacterium]